jgi:hypothetical protein
MTTQTQRKPPTVEQILDNQTKQAERELQRSALPAVAKSTAIATPDARTAIQRWQDDNAPMATVGSRLKFAKGQYVSEDDSLIGDDIDFIALVDQMMVGHRRFRGPGEPPDQVIGNPYDGFIAPPRESLGDNDPAQWELGLDGKPVDPWQPTAFVVLQRVDNGEMFTFTTSSVTGRKAVGNLSRHYDRLQKTNPDTYPVVRLKVSGFQHRDQRVGWVPTPVFAVVGRTPKDSAAKPDTSVAADMSDDIPF